MLNYIKVSKLRLHQFYFFQRLQINHIGADILDDALSFGREVLDRDLSLDTENPGGGGDHTLPCTYPDENNWSGSISDLTLHHSLYLGKLLERTKGETILSEDQHRTPCTEWNNSSNSATSSGSGQVSGRNQSYQTEADGESGEEREGDRYEVCKGTRSFLTVCMYRGEATTLE